MLTNRAVEIIKDLIENEEITAKELSQKFKTTLRTIYYDLENINYFLKKNKFQGSLKNGKKIYFALKEKDGIKKLVGNGQILSAEERQNYLILKLFFKDILNLKKESENLEVARKTIENDIKEIKKELKEHGVEFLSFPAKGISFQGKEAGVRILIELYLVKMLVQKHTLKQQSLELVEEIYHFADGKFLEKLSKKIIEEYNLKASIFVFYTFVAMMVVDRIISGKKMIQEDGEENPLKVKIGEQELERLKSCIKTEKKFGEQCYTQLIVMIRRGEEGFEEEKFDYYFVDSYKKAEQFLNELGSSYFTEEQLRKTRNTLKKELKFLALRFENAIYKYKFNCKENFEISKEFPKRLKPLYTRIEKISRKYFGNLLEEDIERLTYAISEIMDRIDEKKNDSKKVVIVHYNLGIILERDLAKWLSSLWNLEVIKVLAGHELEDFIEKNDGKIDGIILFEGGYLRRIESDIPKIVLNVFSLEESSKILLDYGYDKKNIY